MPYLHHCRFRNTLADLKQCNDSMDEILIIEDEISARRELVSLCRQIADEWTKENGEIVKGLQA